MTVTGSEGRDAGGNRLGGSTSPYLLQHKDNPVDWYPWGPEALAAARSAGKPIFLSIGYSACHWCHVMEEESFVDPATAAVMNDYFINIKVDREERPDLDDIYMTAVQMLTGSGGWPMSVWLTPDLKPFYGGTYFPPDSRHGRPSFVQVLTALGEGWRRDKAPLVAQAEKLHEGVVRYMSGDRIAGEGRALSDDLTARAVQGLEASFDHVYGGFGSAPKFPPHGGLLLMLRRYRSTHDENLARMASLTFDRMASGGLYDQIGGGFHRYSTDPRWMVPHFEKMLYDNALMADAYLEAWRTLGDESYRRVAREIFAWVLREMTSPEGAFYSTLDADSEGAEGRFYVWRPGQVEEAIGPDEAALVCDYYGITPAGNFEGGDSIPHVDTPLAAYAERRGLAPGDLDRRLSKAREALLQARSRRVRPHLDDKILTAWNGMMIGALARGSTALEDPRLAAAAARAADFILRNARGDDGLLRVSWRKGRLHDEGFLDDQAYVIDGLLALHEATGGARWIGEATALAKAADGAFRDPDGKGYFFTKAGRNDLIVRAKNPTDGAIPSGNSVLASALPALHRLTGDRLWVERAGEIFEAFGGAMASMPGAFHYMIGARDRYAASGAVPPEAGPVVTVGAEARSGTAGRGPVLALRLAIREGWHINASKPGLDHLIPTSVTLDPDGAFAIDHVQYPEATMVSLGFAAEPLAVYAGSLTLTVSLRRIQGRDAATVRGAVSFQACNDESCLKPALAGFEASVGPPPERAPRRP